MPVLYTTGYEQHETPDTLVVALQAAGVERVVDVRELPNSRRRGFSKHALAEALGEGGIVYEHERPLGNPHRDLFRAGQFAEGEAAYRTHVRTAGSEALDRVAGSLHVPTCLLCLEASPEHCHRTLVAEALGERVVGLEVVDLA